MYKRKIIVPYRKNKLFCLQRFFEEANLNGINVSPTLFYSQKHIIDSKDRFRTLSSYIINCLMKINAFPDDLIKKRLQNTINYNVLNKNYYLVFPIISAYKYLVPPEKDSEENFRLANILDWCAELIVTGHFMTDDIMDSTEMRCNRLCWNLSSTGILYDIKVLENASLRLLQYHFSDKPYYRTLLDLIHYSNNMSTFGQSMDLNKCFIDQKQNDKKWNSIDMFKYFAERKTYFFISRFSIYAGLCLAGRQNTYPYCQMDSVLKKIAHVQHAQNDIWDLYGSGKFHGKKGNDINEGKFTWLFAKAQQLANSKQLKLLQDNYGKKELENCEVVENVYQELDMYHQYCQFKKKNIQNISKKIEEISDEPVQKVLYECLHILENIDTILLQKKVHASVPI